CGRPRKRPPREPFRTPTNRAGAGGPLGGADLIDAHGVRDVFERLVAEVFFAQLELMSHLVPHGSGYADGTGFGEPLKAGRYVDPLPVGPIALYHYVTAVDGAGK